MDKEDLDNNQIEVNDNIGEPNSQMSNINNPFNDNENIIINDAKEPAADVINTPVPIKISSENANNERINEISFASKFDVIFTPILVPFYKIGKYLQGLISKLSEKVTVQSSYKYFLIFLALGSLFFFFSLFFIPFFIFNPGKLLGLLTIGNIFLMISFLYYYGSKDFFAFLVDQNRTGIMISHILLMIISLIVSLIIGGYFLQLLLVVALDITTVMFFLTIIPGGQGVIAGIKNMLIYPLMILYNTFKGKIFGSNNTVLPQWIKFKDFLSN